MGFSNRPIVFHFHHKFNVLTIDITLKSHLNRNETKIMRLQNKTFYTSDIKYNGIIRGIPYKV